VNSLEIYFASSDLEDSKAMLISVVGLVPIFFSVVDRNVYETIEKKIVISVRMSENMC